MLAYDYPLLGMFWTLLWFFLFVVWIMLLFRVFGDIFRSHDMGGWAKALWSLFIIILPWRTHRILGSCNRLQRGYGRLFGRVVHRRRRRKNGTARRGCGQ